MKKNEKYNIKKVFNDNYDLCCNCGMCEGVCPTNAIQLNEEKGILTPSLYQDKCINCSKCVRYCPRIILGNEDSPLQSKTQKSDKNVGIYEKMYTGYSTSQDVRFNSSSGGISTELSLYLIENGIVNGLILTKIDITAKRPVPFIAKSREDILDASGSKYSIVALNKIMKEIKDFDGTLAIVGLPCHFQALKKLEKEDEKLREKIFLHIGLMCSGTIGFYGTELLLDSVDGNKLKKLAFRGNGWPGGFYAEDVNSKKYFVPFKKYFSLVRFFLPKFCLICDDSFNELADISLGDAWLPNLEKQRNQGINLIISRNEKSEDILRKLTKNGIVKLEEIDLQTIQSGLQYKNAVYKKSNLEIKKKICSIFHKNNLVEIKYRTPVQLVNLIKFLFLFMRCEIMKTKILSIIPTFILKQIIKSEVETNA